jgi:hypothetical protein
MQTGQFQEANTIGCRTKPQHKVQARDLSDVAKLQIQQSWRAHHKDQGVDRAYRYLCILATAYRIHNTLQASNRLLPVLTSREVILFDIQRAHKDRQCTYTGNRAFAPYTAL